MLGRRAGTKGRKMQETAACSDDFPTVGTVCTQGRGVCDQDDRQPVTDDTQPSPLHAPLTPGRPIPKEVWAKPGIFPFRMMPPCSFGEAFKLRMDSMALENVPSCLRSWS